MVNLSNIRLAYGERMIFKSGDFLLRPGDKVGLVGPNGAGKTTLFKVICGHRQPLTRAPFPWTPAQWSATSPRKWARCPAGARWKRCLPGQDAPTRWAGR